MTFLSDIIARMATALANGEVDLGCEEAIETFLRSKQFSEDEIHAGWEEARDDARELRQFGAVLPEMDEVA
ncbi:hypothetical protein [Xanthobacter sediminis]